MTRDALARDPVMCAVFAKRVLARMARPQDATILDRFAELLCGGEDTAYALTVSEAARFLGLTSTYGRVLLQRLHERTFGGLIGG